MERLRVLLATDGSEPTIRAAELLVQMVSEPIEARVFTVISYTFYPYPLFAGGQLADPISRVLDVEDLVDEATRDVKLILEKAGIDVTVGHRFGNVADEILTEVEKWDPNLLLLGRRGVRGLERVMGSVSEHVLRRSHVPVLLVP